MAMHSRPLLQQFQRCSMQLSRQKAIQSMQLSSLAYLHLSSIHSTRIIKSNLPISTYSNISRHIKLQRHQDQLISYSTRHLSTSNTIKPSHLERLKDLWQKYGIVAIVTYLSMYGVTLGGIYIAIENGWISRKNASRSDDYTINVVSTTNRFVRLAEEWGVAEYLDIQRVNPKTGSFLLAWIATKFTEPIRLGLTLMITPRIARFVGRAPPKSLK